MDNAFFRKYIDILDEGADTARDEFHISDAKGFNHFVHELGLIAGQPAPHGDMYTRYDSATYSNKEMNISITVTVEGAGEDAVFDERGNLQYDNATGHIKTHDPVVAHLIKFIYKKAYS